MARPRTMKKQEQNNTHKTKAHKQTQTNEKVTMLNRLTKKQTGKQGKQFQNQQTGKQTMFNKKTNKLATNTANKSTNYAKQTNKQ